MYDFKYYFNLRVTFMGIIVRVDNGEMGVVLEGTESTSQLHFGDVLLPPEELLVDPDGREEVVEVHDRVHEAVQQGREEGAAARHEHHRVPRHQRDGRVVVHVQKRHLVELLAQQHEPLNKQTITVHSNPFITIFPL